MLCDGCKRRSSGAAARRAARSGAAGAGTFVSDDGALLSDTQQRWVRGEISNFEYLAFVNARAGRTVNDLTQYPVFPWVLADYESADLDLTDTSPPETNKTFRDLSKPVGALNPKRLEGLLERFKAMPRLPPAQDGSGMMEGGLPPPFIYGTHYSTPGYVLFYLLRREPELMLRLQAGRFDDPDRLFNSVADTWKSCLSNPADVKELTQNFIQVVAILCNADRLDLGVTQGGRRVGDVALPPWANGSAATFVRRMREALESEYVSANLHSWIDLVFGVKQRGEAAVAANNLFYYLTYEGAVDLDLLAQSDPTQLKSVEAQIGEFGQTPSQIFHSSHPRRDIAGVKAKLTLGKRLL